MTRKRRVLSVVFTLLLGGAPIVAIGCLDYSLGFGFNLFPLYLVPLAITAWSSTLPLTACLSFLAGASIILKLFLTKGLYAHTFFWYWDGGVKVVMLTLLSLGLWRIRQLQLLQERQNRAKISELNTSLKNQVEQLTAANRELAEVSYTISHDLRAPLRHIIGFVELLKARSLPVMDDKSRHYLQVISQSTQKMGNLIDGLLAFSQLGRTELVKTRVNPNAVVRQVLRELAKQTKGRQIEWQIDRLPTVVADPALIHLVLFNLISNAVKFTEPRSPAKIAIGALEGNRETLFFVRDNGVGFDMKYVGKLFNMFQRLHRSDEFEGTGVGLANVQRVVLRHGGRVWAEGAVDGGATIWFALPKVDEATPHPKSPPL